jgi:hypothetical protein
MNHAASAPERRDLLAELYRRADWRQTVEAIGLGDLKARQLRIEIIRKRAFGRGRRARPADTGEPVSRDHALNALHDLAAGLGSVVGRRAEVDVPDANEVEVAL